MNPIISFSIWDDEKCILEYDSGQAGTDKALILEERNHIYTMMKSQRCYDPDNSHH